ncbi:MAG: helix-turn-helix domain-containing protein [Treponema sp.]|nr:helix-turn-helix domain-containing protein [Treponema sp.]
MSFRNNLREALDFSYMEQKELAAKTGLSLKTIENYVKKDASVPAADKAVRIAQALGVTVEYLVTGKNAAGERGGAQVGKEVIDILTKLDAYNYEVVVALAQTLLHLQSGKHKR